MSDTVLRLSYEAARQRLWLPDDIRNMSVNIVGGKGVGKSRIAGRQIAFFDLLRGVPQAVFDPDGNSIENLLDKVSRLPDREAEVVSQRIVYINTRGMGGYVAPFPLYVRHGEESLAAVSQRYPEVIRRIDPALQTASQQGWPPFWRLASFTGEALTALGLQITEAEDLLADPGRYVPRLLQAALKEPELASVVAFFRDEYPSWGRQLLNTRTASFLTKLTLFRTDPALRAMFGASHPMLDWSEVERKRLTVLIDFQDERDTGEGLRFKFLWIFQSLLDYLKSRGPDHDHIPFSLILDELPYLLSLETASRSLFEADLRDLSDRISRKGMVWLTVLSQRLSQLSPAARATVMSMGSQIIGSVTDQETAYELARRFFPYDPSWSRKSDPVFASYRGNSWVIGRRTTEFSMSEQWEQQSRLFLELPRFQFLAAVAPAEGTPGAQLNRISIADLDRGQYVDKDRVGLERLRLMQLRGQRQDDILAEIEARRSAISLPDTSPRSTEGAITARRARFGPPEATPPSSVV